MQIYDTETLIGVVLNLKTAQQFLLDKFFPQVVESDTEFVAIDVDVGLRRMAPFVSPLVEGKLVEQRRYQTNEFKPAYIKDKRAPDLRKPIRRQIGERIGGEFSGAERFAANVAAELTDQIDIVNRRLEWMAAQALTLGKVTITGDGFPTVVVDFGRDPALTVALTAGKQWTAANITAGTASPTGDVVDWQTAVLKSSGAKVTDIVFTNKAWKGFLLDPVLKGAIYYPALAPQFGNAVNPGAKIDKGAVYMGRWGQYDLWLYNDWFIDPVDNVEKPMLPDGAVVLAGDFMQGTRAFGAIQDPSFNYGALAYAPKMWIHPDPAQLFMLMQSSPIVIPSRVNAALAATVA